jgi:N-acyl-D-amino-acid deacylase
MRIGLMFMAATMAVGAQGQEAFDTLIRGARVVDGAGNPWFTADVAMREGRIAAVGRLGAVSAAKTVDAKGLDTRPRLH